MSAEDILGDDNVNALGMEASSFEQLQIADAPAGNAKIAGGMFSIMRFGIALRNKVHSLLVAQDGKMSALEGKLGMVESRAEDTKTSSRVRSVSMPSRLRRRG